MIEKNYYLETQKIKEFLEKHNFQKYLQHPAGENFLNEITNIMKGIETEDAQIKYEDDKIVITSSYGTKNSKIKDVRTIQIDKNNLLNKTFHVSQESFEYADGKMVQYYIEDISPEINQLNGFTMKKIVGHTFVPSQSLGKTASGVTGTVREENFDQNGIQINTIITQGSIDKLMMGSYGQARELEEATKGSLDMFERLAKSKGYDVTEHIESSIYRIWPDIIECDTNIVKNGRYQFPERKKSYASLRGSVKNGLKVFGSNDSLTEEIYEKNYSKRTMEEIEKMYKEKGCSEQEIAEYQTYIYQNRAFIVSKEEKEAMSIGR